MRARPVNLNLFTIAFPVTAIVSILHRMSGIVLFLLIPLFLGFLHNSLIMPEFFLNMQAALINSVFNKLILWLGFSALIYHLLAGMRHVFMELGCGESKNAARVSAFVVIICAVVVSLLFGWYLC